MITILIVVSLTTTSRKAYDFTLDTTVDPLWEGRTVTESLPPLVSRRCPPFLSGHPSHPRFPTCPDFRVKVLFFQFLV